MEEIFCQIEFFRGYNISEISRLNAGIDNRVYLLKCDKEKYIVRICNQQRYYEDPNNFLCQANLLKRLSDTAYFSVPNILNVFKYKDTLAMIYPFIQGVCHIPKTELEISSLIHVLEFNKGFNNFQQLDRRKTLNSYRQNVNELCDGFSSVWGCGVKKIKAELFRCLDTVTRQNNNLVHGDFHLGNIIWKGNNIVAVLDWDNWAIGDIESDVAHCYIDILLLSNEKMAGLFLEGCINELKLEYSNLRFFLHYEAVYAEVNMHKWRNGFFGENFSMSRDRSSSLLNKVFNLL